MGTALCRAGAGELEQIGTGVVQPSRKAWVLPGHHPLCPSCQ